MYVVLWSFLFKNRIWIGRWCLFILHYLFTPATSSDETTNHELFNRLSISSNHNKFYLHLGEEFYLDITLLFLGCFNNYTTFVIDFDDRLFLCSFPECRPSSIRFIVESWSFDFKQPQAKICSGIDWNRLMWFIDHNLSIIFLFSVEGVNPLPGKPIFRVV